jgi:putative DNA primase/helicase
VSIAEAIGRALGGRKAAHQWMVRCVAHADRTPSLSLRDGTAGRLLVHCHAGCQALDVLAELRRQKLIGSNDCRRKEDERDFSRRSAPVTDQSAVELAQQIFEDAVEPRRGPVEVYLRSRGLGQLPDDVIDLRYHPRCPRGRDRLPAMVALMRDAVSNVPTGVHRTFLRSDGSGKADVAPAKMMLGRAAGSVVKLTPDEDVVAGLGLSEGLEDGIAIINLGWRPIWTCMSAVGMQRFSVLLGIEALTLFADADPAGLQAARSCASRWSRAGSTAAVVDPEKWKDFAAMAEALRRG